MGASPNGQASFGTFTHRWISAARAMVVIALSNSGESNEILALIPVLKRQQVKLICITSRPESSMARAADIDIRRARHAALRPAGDTDKLHLLALEDRDQREDFIRFAGVRQRNYHHGARGGYPSVRESAEGGLPVRTGAHVEHHRRAGDG